MISSAILLAFEKCTCADLSCKWMSSFQMSFVAYLFEFLRSCRLCKSRYCFGILKLSVTHYQVLLSSFCYVGMAVEMREGLQFRLVIFLRYELLRNKILSLYLSVVSLNLFCAAQASSCSYFGLCTCYFRQIGRTLHESICFCSLQTFR